MGKLDHGKHPKAKCRSGTALDQTSRRGQEHWTPRRISRAANADMLGPTTGDKTRLADTDLLVEVMMRDIRKVRDERPYVFASLRKGEGPEAIVTFVIDKGGLVPH